MIRERAFAPEDLARLETTALGMSKSSATMFLHENSGLDLYVCSQWADAIARDNPDAHIAYTGRVC